MNAKWDAAANGVKGALPASGILPSTDSMLACRHCGSGVAVAAASSVYVPAMVSLPSPVFPYDGVTVHIITE